MKLLRTLLLLCCLGLLGPGPLLAQPAIFEVAPLYLSADGWRAESGGSSAVLSARRRVPLYFFLPDVSQDSGVDFLGASAGYRMGSDDAELAWAVRPLDVLVSKAPWTGGLTLLSYDRSGPLRVEADWLALRFGPTLRWGRPGASLEARLTVEGSVATKGLTGVVFEGPRAASTGFDGDLAGRIVAHLGTQVIASARASMGGMAAGDRPATRSWQAAIELWPERRLAVAIQAGQLEVWSDALSRTSTWLVGASILLNPGQPGY